MRVNWKVMVFVLLMLSFSYSVVAQDVRMDSTSSFSQRLAEKRNGIGLRGGFLFTYGLTYQRMLGNKSALDLTMGHRPEGGFVRWASDRFTRTGAMLTYKHFVTLDEDPTGLIFLYFAGGFNAAWVDNTKVVSSGYLNGGPTLGLGLDLRFPKYVIDLGVLTGYDLLNGPYDPRFVWYKGSGIAIRYLF
jgi:hypothetical protein